MTSRALHTLLHTIVDYAGLFPPAGLGMDRALGLYASYQKSTHAWMLARFILPVARLDEFKHAMNATGVPYENPWRLSALPGDDVETDITTVLAFNAAKGQAMIDALEVKASTVDAIESIARLVPPGLKVYVEIPIDRDPGELVAALARRKLRAKMRTGGVVPGAIPPAADVARFLRACYAAGVGFKATAGLHHPLRSEQALTYEPDSPRAVMHGFLNVFLAAVLHYNGITARDTIDLLEMDTLDGVVMDDEKISWREYTVTVGEISTIRRRHAVSFGSCSFADPVDDLQNMGLLT